MIHSLRMNLLLAVAAVFFVGCRSGGEISESMDSEDLAAAGNPAASVVGQVKASELPKSVKAFLDMVAYAEGTHGSYNIIYGGTKFSSFADHPRQYRASPWGTPGVGSDAAGRYQFKSTSWDESKRKLGLKDFSPASQDRAAVYLMQRNGTATYENVKNSEQKQRFNTAVSSLSHVWASLPPQRYPNQRVKSLEELWRVYQKALARY